LAGRYQNLKPWQKGVSGNPGGRPKRDTAAEIAQAIFGENPEAIYGAMLKALKKGDPRVFAVLAERAFGKQRKCIEVTTGDEVLAALAEGRKRVADMVSREPEGG
jgi:hypothetical protein